ncbi:MAG: TonB-dependent receptor [Ginsengibacter sp.]
MQILLKPASYSRHSWQKLLLKTLRIMKITAFLLLITCLQINAKGIAQKVNLNFKNVPLQKVFKEVSKQTGMSIIYEENLLNGFPPITIVVRNATVQQVLDNSIKNLPIIYTIQNNSIVIKRKTSVTTSFQSDNNLLDTTDITIKGKVLNEKGEPLQNVSVLISGTKIGTTTNSDGRFTLTTPNDKNIVLEISSVGYQTKKVSVGKQTEVNVVLETDAMGLSDVVVVGYGTQKKNDITGAIGSITDDQIGNYPVTNTTQILQGKVAGVMVTAVSGAPGAGVNVRIRGIGTVNDNGPLYVIDGQPFNNMDNMNPADIESIEILKDASASAIYGSRAANGVVLVTTKRGSTGKIKISMESYVGVSSAWKSPVQLNSDEYYDMIKTAHLNGGTTPSPNLESEYQKGYNTNWWDEYTQNGVSQNYFLSISGGSEKARYSVSGGYFGQEGLIIGTDYKRYTFRSNIDFDITKRIKLGINFSINNSVRNAIPEGARWTFGLISEGINMDPMVPVINPDADPNDPNYEFNKFGFTSVTDAYNPVAYAARTFNKSKGLRIQGNVYLDYTILRGLVFRSNVGSYVNNANSYIFNPSFYLAPWEQRSNNSVSRGFTEDKGFVWENRLTYSKLFGDHSITAMAAFTAENYENEGFNGSKQTIPSNDPAFRVLQAATTSDQITGNINSNSLLSELNRINYAYKNRYLLTATYRIDGSSRFANDKWGKFPSTAIGWKLSEESFFKNLNTKFVDNLKFRFGWGQIGNQNIPNYSYLSLISGGNARRYVIGDTPLQGYSPSSVGNPDIKWETVEQTNIGLDLGLFEHKFSMSVDYYTKKTKNMLLSVPLPYYLGYPSNPWSNEGSVINSGFEFQIDYQDQISDFKYDIGLNLTTLKNEVLSLGSGGAIFGGQSRMGLVTKTDVGHPIGSFYGFVMDGIFQNKAQVDAGSQPNANPGDVRFKDIAGPPDVNGKPTGPDGIINENDRTYLGSPNPDFFMGTNINLQYKRIGINMFFQGVFGNKIYSATKYFSYAPVGYFNTSKKAYTNAWHGEGTSNSQPIISSNTASDNYRNSSFYVEDGSYLRIKNIQLTYSIPLKSISTGSELQVYLSAQNLLTFTKYSGLDPELGSSTLLDVGIDYGVYPQPRTLMIGAKFNF